MLNYASSLVTDGITAYYPFNEGSGTSTRDYFGGYNLTASSSNVLSTCVSGVSGKCANFSSGGNLSGLFANWSVNESFTISYWTNSQGSNYVINGIYLSINTTNNTGFQMKGSVLNRMITTTFQNSTFSSSVNFPIMGTADSNWHNIIYIWNHSDPLYINGCIDGVCSKINYAISPRFRDAGNNPILIMNPTFGSLDEVIIWNRSISNTTEVQSVYNNGNGIYIKTLPPQISLNSNLPNDYLKSGMNIQLNITANDTNLSNVWYNYNGTNVFINGAISGIYNLTNITTTSNRTITIYANDTYGGLNTETFNLFYKVFENSQTYVNTTYSGVSNTFSINITSPNLSSLMLNYNGTNYTASTYPSGSNTIGSVNIVAPSFSTNQNISFYWIFTMLDSSIISNSAKNQSVSTINLGNTYPNLLYNITIKDEATGAVIPNNNVTMAYSVTYGVTNTSIIGTNLFNDNKLSNKNMSLDVNANVYMAGSITYSAFGYIGRTYSFIEDSINSSTYKNITLYLSNSSSSYVKTMLVTDEAGRGRPSLFFQYTQLLGVKTLVATEQLDSTGKTTIVFVPNTQYTFEFYTSGCSNATKNIIFYDQSDYTQVLSCSSYNPDDYVDPFEAMRVSFYPSGVFYVDNTTNASNSLFSVNVSGNSAFCNNINALSFTVKNSAGTTIVNDNANNCDVLSGSGYFNLGTTATGTLYVLLDSGETKTLTFTWIKSYSDSDYSNYSIIELISQVGNSDDILGIDWKFKLAFCLIGLFGIIIALTFYQRTYNFSNFIILIVVDAYLWMMCFIGWGDINIGASGGGITSLISKYALLILGIIGSVAIIATKEDEYS